jgi:DNA-3-methyladenine glycosylase II
MASGLTKDEHAPEYWDEACNFLIQADERWKRLVLSYQDRALRTRGNPFETLGRSLVGQQISVKAADAVWNRLMDRLGGVFSQSALEKLPDDALRAAGLSGQKVKYLRALSDFQAQGMLELAYLSRLTDEDSLKHLCKVKGIGPWTAQMFLIFGLRRPDVWPVDDIGIQRGISLQFRQGAPTGRLEAIQFGETIKPWRTVASWYLWRSLDPAVVDY